MMAIFSDFLETILNSFKMKILFASEFECEFVYKTIFLGRKIGFLEECFRGTSSLVVARVHSHSAQTFVR